jgi:lipopolysaccharide export system protein LptA
MRVTRAALTWALVALALPALGDDPKNTRPQPSANAAAERLGLKFSRDAELVITSEEAEGTKGAEGRESVIFSKHVKAVQGDMILVCDWLEAIYPQANASRPDKISAKGSVVITQGTNEARCSDAQIDNVACTAECTNEGDKAKLRRNTDDVAADKIYFDLCKGTVKAVGGVSIRVRQKENPSPAPGEAPQPAAPKAEGG